MGTSYEDASFLQEAHDAAMEGSVKQMAEFYAMVQRALPPDMDKNSALVLEGFAHSLEEEAKAPRFSPDELVVSLQDEVF